MVMNLGSCTNDGPVLLEFPPSPPMPQEASIADGRDVHVVEQRRQRDAISWDFFRIALYL